MFRILRAMLIDKHCIMQPCGNLRAKLDKVSDVDYVFAVVHNEILEVYRPTRWYLCEYNTQLAPHYNPKEDRNRKFFVGSPVKNSEYKGRNITEFCANPIGQNPVIYLDI